jgi:hypothetical protein
MWIALRVDCEQSLHFPLSSRCVAIGKQEKNVSACLSVTARFAQTVHKPIASISTVLDTARSCRAFKPFLSAILKDVVQFRCHYIHHRQTPELFETDVIV